MTGRFLSHGIVVAFLLAICAPSVYAGDPDCRFDEITEWNPTGWVGCTAYGEGVASAWQGPGVARPDCLWPWLDCQPLAVQSLDTGITIVVTPSMFCGCWVNGVGPDGEMERLIDLDPAAVAALGLDASRGLWPVKVSAFRENQTAMTLPDTAVRP